ncbi:MAG: four helix bundle protein [Clostridia bacterium]|nr:four helix bundle protein [Clostridia bacterium]
MKENKLVELSIDFSVDIINLVKYLKANHESIISNQIGRSGTSVGANIHEAQYAQGTHSRRRQAKETDEARQSLPLRGEGVTAGDG